MKIIFIFIFIFIFIQNFANASAKSQIINNFQNINNIKFYFIQKINEKTESGNCAIVYPKKIFCKYKDKYNKILVSNGKSLVINSDRNKQYYRYNLNKTPLNIILDKNLMIKKMKDLNNENEFIDNYSFKFIYENNHVTIFFDKKNLNLKGWATTDIYQNKVETLISNIEINSNIDEKIFNIQNYIN